MILNVNNTIRCLRLNNNSKTTEEAGEAGEEAEEEVRLKCLVSVMAFLLSSERTAGTMTLRAESLAALRAVCF